MALLTGQYELIGALIELQGLEQENIQYTMLCVQICPFLKSSFLDSSFLGGKIRGDFCVSISHETVNVIDAPIAYLTLLVAQKCLEI